MPQRAYHHGNLRRVLLDAALALFAERGSFDFTFRELARAAGVTHNAPYRHFASKGELLLAVRAEGFAELAQACRAALSHASEDPRARVRALGEAYVRFALAWPHHFRLMLLNPSGEEAPSAEHSEAFEILSGAIDEGRARGIVRDDLSTRELSLAAWALVHGLASLVAGGQLPRGDVHIRKNARVLDAVFFEGALKRISSNGPTNSARK